MFSIQRVRSCVVPVLSGQTSSSSRCSGTGWPRLRASTARTSAAAPGRTMIPPVLSLRVRLRRSKL
ncbi:hypothetical protein ACFSZS_19805 [Seohaeicola zhoushanensis]